jgi:hypothetical protein
MCVHQTWAQKNFVKATDQNSAGYTYLKDKFPRISKAQIKEGVFGICWTSIKTVNYWA